MPLQLQDGTPYLTSSLFELLQQAVLEKEVESKLQSFHRPSIPSVYLCLDELVVNSMVV